MIEWYKLKTFEVMDGQAGEEAENAGPDVDDYDALYLYLYPTFIQHNNQMGIWSDTLVKVGLAQAGPKITPHDRAVLECGGYPSG